MLPSDQLYSLQKAGFHFTDVTEVQWVFSVILVALFPLWHQRCLSLQMPLG